MTVAPVGVPDPARRGSLRNRLLACFVALVAGALLLAGTTTVLFVRRGAQHEALASVRHKAANIEANLTKLQSLLPEAATARTRVGQRATNNVSLRVFLNQLRATAQVSDARLIVMRDGQPLTYEELVALPRGRAFLGDDPDAQELVTLPGDVTSEQLQLASVGDGATSTLTRGSTVYLATPLDIPAIRPSVTVLVISEAIDKAGVRRATFAFLVSAFVALAVCIAVAAWLSRRLTRPLVAIDRTARALAGGDLAARVPIDAATDRELADVAVTMNRMAEDLDASRNAERMFLQAVSHDLRTPLTSIRGYSEALADGTLDAADTESRVRAANVITTEARRLERLVADLLDLSRLESREFSLRPRPCDALAVVETTADGFRPQAASLGIELVTEHVPADATIDADLDPERLGQAVANLLENALKYANQRVVVTTRCDATTVTVEINDDGPGVPDGARARVFERLYTTRDTPGRAVGTGLGLAIVHELATAMGGRCTLAGTDGSGTRFELVVQRGLGAQ